MLSKVTTLAVGASAINLRAEETTQEEPATGELTDYREWTGEWGVIESNGVHVVSHQESMGTADQMKELCDSGNGDGNGTVEEMEVPEGYRDIFYMADRNGNGQVTWDELQRVAFNYQLYMVPTDGGVDKRIVGDLQENGGPAEDEQYYRYLAQSHIRSAENDYYGTYAYDQQLDWFECPDTYRRLHQAADTDQNGVVSLYELTALYNAFNIHEIGQDDTAAQDTAQAQGEEGIGDTSRAGLEDTTVQQLAQVSGGYRPNMDPQHRQFEAEGQPMIESFGVVMIDFNYANDMADVFIGAQDANGDGILQKQECDDVYADLFAEGDTDGNDEINTDEMRALVYNRQLYIVPTDENGNNQRQVGALMENGGEKQDWGFYWDQGWGNIYQMERDYYLQGSHDGVLDAAECPLVYSKLFQYSDTDADGRVTSSELANTYQLYNVHELSAHSEDDQTQEF